MKNKMISSFYFTEESDWAFIWNEGNPDVSYSNVNYYVLDNLKA